MQWGWAGLLRKERKDGDYKKTVFKLREEAGRGQEEVGCGRNRGIYGADCVLGEMAYRLCVVESSGGGNGPPVALLVCHAGSRRHWGL